VTWREVPLASAAALGRAERLHENVLGPAPHCCRVPSHERGYRAARRLRNGMGHQWPVGSQRRAGATAWQEPAAFGAL